MIEEHDDQDGAQHRLRHLGRRWGGAPVPGKEQHTKEEGQRGQGELGQDGRGKRDALPAEA